MVAYIFAAPVSVGDCTGPGTCDLTPGDPTRLSDAAQLADGANPIDSVTGFTGFDDANGDGEVQQDEIITVPGLAAGQGAGGAAGLRQPVPDCRSRPRRPSFFLIPGNNQVTVLWQPSVHARPRAIRSSRSRAPRRSSPEGGGDPVPNPLFDPNYRQFDVEGYRVYRGRVDSPNSLQLLAQFDYTGTVISGLHQPGQSGRGLRA